ncbi:hypothetical protein SeMB42_g01129 [Synchytrium endobioticum]|uniref:5'-3' exoribonuclease 1 n=1 Tax=Synchytrium endobioticum TaxID=286115 RepID=A0A507DN81_9FUNG|nr:hypothetical protein SeMB42_g01129 [Synchytrium endobioticum]
MGIPKFFRWMSERYPLCSQLITENGIPEFDNLYLDMNGIIHACSHPNDGDVHFRLSEEAIFLAIFNYIDALFGKIRPKKLFFMAVDGVAPRAKMNQQRARRFRTAKEADEARKRAERKGEKLPKEPPFDSNCITPGTYFMTRLSAQLKYFVNKKMTNDTSWHGVQVVLSGHEVPGEGEHKIMEYLRLAKSRPEWDPNTRHCLYGLDADLIMLGLLSHEPHFALLREEVTFGKIKKTPSASANPDTQSFYLLHLSLLREYLNLEFAQLRETLPFPYDLERIIDDFILMAFFVGNDFLPHLPTLHINEGALATMFSKYKKILPTLGGYLNDGGNLNLGRCEVLLRAISEVEREKFEDERLDLKWLSSKMDREGAGPANGQKKKKINVITPSQKKILESITDFICNPPSQDPARLWFGPNLSARDRGFLRRVAKDLTILFGEDIKDLEHPNVKSMYLEVDSDEDQSEDESSDARNRVLRRYAQMEVSADVEMTSEMREAANKKLIEEEYQAMKKHYYKEKLEIDRGNKEQMEKLVYHYVEGLQWVLLYYYEGVASWEWFYPYHYAPMTSDLVDLARFKFEFQLGQPFLPFEQLMGVLPAASKQLIPAAYQDLMTDSGSPIIDMYPIDFQLDMNGKKAQWEAVVKIPFVDQTRLLRTLKAREGQLSQSEKQRNTWGPSTSFTYDPKNPQVYTSPIASVFPDIAACVCKMEDYNLPVVGLHGLVKGLCPGVQLGKHYMPGFPSLHTLSHTGVLSFHSVNVFGVESLRESMVITLSDNGKKAEDVCWEKFEKKVYISWPYLTEASVVGVSDEYFYYTLVATPSCRTDIVRQQHTERSQDRFSREAEKCEGQYSKRFGTIIGPVDIMLHVLPLKGMALKEDGSLVKEFAENDIMVPMQTVVDSVATEDPRFLEKPPPPLSEEFPLCSRVFFLGGKSYGCIAEIQGYNENKLVITLLVPKEPELENGLDFTRDMASEAQEQELYLPAYQVCRLVGISALALSKSQKVLGYSRKTENGWEYTQKVIDLIREYKSKFPEVLAVLDEKQGRGEFYEDTDFFPPDKADEKLAELREWLNLHGVKGLERVSLASNALTKDHVHEIQAAVDEIYKDIKLPGFKKITVRNVPRHSVLKPAHAKNRLAHQHFDLGDRVLYVADIGIVPFGSPGTIVGLDGPLVEVLFDRPFMGGTTLDDRCAPSRGMEVSKYTILNLTNPQPPVPRPNGSASVKQTYNRIMKGVPASAQETNETRHPSRDNCTQINVNALFPNAENVAWKKQTPKPILSRYDVASNHVLEARSVSTKESLVNINVNGRNSQVPADGIVEERKIGTLKMTIIKRAVIPSSDTSVTTTAAATVVTPNEHSCSSSSGGTNTKTGTPLDKLLPAVPPVAGQTYYPNGYNSHSYGYYNQQPYSQAPYYGHQNNYYSHRNNGESAGVITAKLKNVLNVVDPSETR